ncbi:MAG: metal-dependent hydrolase [Selenomonadaceae bacterium]|nr:metal-dependent hydrolase [Selenomonadaceae bacterium]
MKWINHQIVTGFIVYAATDNALFVASSIVGAVIPDRVEGSPPTESAAYWKWRKNHRTWSHYPPLYLGLMAAAQIAISYFQNPKVELVLSLLIYALVGAVLHIVEDGICGKVPVFTPRRKHGIKLFTVGSWREYFFAGLIVCGCLLYRYKELFLVNG